MKVKRALTVATAFALAAVAGRAQPAAPAPPPAAPVYKIQFGTDDDASWDNWKQGKAFICLSKDTAVDCFSFYIKDTKLIVYGPGCTDNATNGKCADLPARETTFGTSNATTFSQNITVDIYNQMAKIGTAWNAKALEPGRCDSSAFANQMARAAGLKTPAMTSTQTPKSYVATLAKLNTTAAPAAASH